MEEKISFSFLHIFCPCTVIHFPFLCSLWMQKDLSGMELRNGMESKSFIWYIMNHTYRWSGIYGRFTSILLFYCRWMRSCWLWSRRSQRQPCSRMQRLRASSVTAAPCSSSTGCVRESKVVNGPFNIGTIITVINALVSLKAVKIKKQSIGTLIISPYVQFDKKCIEILDWQRTPLYQKGCCRFFSVPNGGNLQYPCSSSTSF